MRMLMGYIRPFAARFDRFDYYSAASMLREYIHT